MFQFFMKLAVDTDFEGVLGPLKQLMGDFMGPLITVIGVAAGLFGAYIGIMFGTAGGDEQKLAKAKKALIWFIVGIIVIFAVMVIVPRLITTLGEWAKDNA